jgi:hypothetical protein
VSDENRNLTIDTDTERAAQGDTGRSGYEYGCLQ